MENLARPGRFIRFKNFVLDLQTRELYRRGLRVKLRGQPIEVLAILTAHPGELITRETLRKVLWPQDTFVDFEHSLNSTVNRLREALGDNLEAPRFVETVPRLGYRFIASLTEDAPRQNAGEAAESVVHWESKHASDPAANPTGMMERPAFQGHALHGLAIPVETRIRLAVLPFESVSDEPHDHITDGLSAQMIVQLGRTYKHLSIIGPVSSLYFTGGIHSFPSIAQTLKADYLLVGNVWRVPPSLRIFAQLIRTADQCCVWSESYTRQNGDVLAVLDLITRDISRGLLQALPQIRTLEASLSTSPENYEKYLKARSLSFRFNQASFLQAMALFEETIQGNPNFAPAQAELALMLTAAVMFGGAPPKSFYERIEQHANKALELYDGSAEAHTATGFLRAAHGDWQVAECAFLHAIEINPSLIGAHAGYSQMSSVLGFHERAIRFARQACALDPLSPIVHAILGSAYYYAGQFESAVEGLRRSIELEPNFAPATATLSFVHEAKSRYDDALQEARNTADFAGQNPLMQCVLARALALAGMTEEASRILENLVEAAKARYISSAWIALIYAALGQRQEAWAWLERAFVEHDPWRVFLNVDPRFRYFADDARFAELLHEIGLAPASSPVQTR
jgi:DNA-binding winged helix-turn-helix (wHTH) protein/TolB-like protein